MASHRWESDLIGQEPAEIITTEFSSISNKDAQTNPTRSDITGGNVDITAQCFLNQPISLISFQAAIGWIHFCKNQPAESEACSDRWFCQHDCFEISPCWWFKDSRTSVIWDSSVETQLFRCQIFLHVNRSSSVTNLLMKTVWYSWKFQKQLLSAVGLFCQITISKVKNELWCCQMLFFF